MQLFSVVVDNIFTDAVSRLSCVEPGTFLLTAVCLLYVFHMKCKHARIVWLPYSWMVNRVDVTCLQLDQSGFVTCSLNKKCSLIIKSRTSLLIVHMKAAHSLKCLKFTPRLTLLSLYPNYAHSKTSHFTSTFRKSKKWMLMRRSDQVQIILCMKTSVTFYLKVVFFSPQPFSSTY